MKLQPSPVTKQKITVYHWDKLWKTEEVEAELVGGEEGVFASWRKDNLVHLAVGDDGFWRCVGTYDEFWIPSILVAIKRADGR